MKQILRTEILGDGVPDGRANSGFNLGEEPSAVVGGTGGHFGEGGTRRRWTWALGGAASGRGALLSTVLFFHVWTRHRRCYGSFFSAAPCEVVLATGQSSALPVSTTEEEVLPTPPPPATTTLSVNEEDPSFFPDLQLCNIPSLPANTPSGIPEENLVPQKICASSSLLRTVLKPQPQSHFFLLSLFRSSTSMSPPPFFFFHLRLIQQQSPLSPSNW